MATPLGFLQRNSALMVIVAILAIIPATRGYALVALHLTVLGVLLFGFRYRFHPEGGYRLKRLPVIRDEHWTPAYRRAWLIVSQNGHQVRFGPMIYPKPFGRDEYAVCLGPGGHRSPKPGCWCGLYSVPTKSMALERFGSESEAAAPTLYVGLGGDRIVSEDNVYRSEHQVVAAVWVPSGCTTCRQVKPGMLLAGYPGKWWLKTPWLTLQAYCPDHMPPNSDRIVFTLAEIGEQLKVRIYWEPELPPAWLGQTGSFESEHPEGLQLN